MKLIKLINPENVSEEEVKHYRCRGAGRAVVMDNDGIIALLHVTKKGYYKLPGGGVEDTEDKMIALKRECQEEIGCDIEVIGAIGTIVEYRKIFGLKQTSYCYLAKVKGEKGKPAFTDDEKENGFEQVWLPYKEALRALLDSKATNIEGSAYIVPRDTAFLQEAKSLIKKNELVK
ncbi:NUDIX domain-containing protein [Candidatus Parcubacteria bacterium]|nr:NUDIX domain-containing protein [Candidatus Parcubacteria bacterium]